MATQEGREGGREEPNPKSSSRISTRSGFGTGTECQILQGKKWVKLNQISSSHEGNGGRQRQGWKKIFKERGKVGCTRTNSAQIACRKVAGMGQKVARMGNQTRQAEKQEGKAQGKEMTTTILSQKAFVHEGEI